MDEELIKSLKEFGLTEYEASAYVALTLLGSGKASEISKKANIPQSKIYEVLDSLAKKQLIEFIGGRPKEYRAIDLHLGLHTLIEMEERRIENLKKKVEKLKLKIKKLNVKEDFGGCVDFKRKGIKAVY